MLSVPTPDGGSGCAHLLDMNPHLLEVQASLAGSLPKKVILRAPRINPNSNPMMRWSFSTMFSSRLEASMARATEVSDGAVPSDPARPVDFEPQIKGLGHRNMPNEN